MNGYDGYTISEAAAQLGISEQAVRHRVRVGHIPARRVGLRLWLLDRAAVDAAAPAGRMTPGRKPRLVHAP